MIHKNSIFSNPSISNDRFSYTDVNFYKKKIKNTPRIQSYSISDYKDIFKNFYKNRNSNNNDNQKDSHHEINNYYLECQKNVKNYFMNEKHKFGLKFEGNKQLENYTLNKFNNIFHKACSAREQILRKQILNYYYPKDNNDKLMGEKMKLTPIPTKKLIYLKNENEKNEYLKAKRSAVCMRRLEYTHGLKKHNSQDLSRTNYKKKNDEIDFLSILKGAILIIEDWWLKILNRKYLYLYNNNDNDLDLEDNYTTLSEKDSTNSIEKKILENLNNNKNNNSKNFLIDDWLFKQTERIIKDKEKNNFINDNIYSFRNNKGINNLKKVKNNSIISLNSKNKIGNIFKSNRRYKNLEKKNKNNINKINNNQNSNTQNPIKIIQNSSMSPFDYNINFGTSISPSNYLQNYFKNYCLNNDSQNNGNSHRDLKNFEQIQNKYHKNIYLLSSMNNNDINIDINQNVLLSEDELKNQEINIIDNRNQPINNILRGKKSKSQNNIDNKNKNNKNNKNENEIFKTKQKKDISSDIEPVLQDDLFDIINDNIISTANINDINKNKSLKIRYNIIKSQNFDNRNMSEKSSMDGSIDEIITRKLKEAHNNNGKYTQRILKAYNQVKIMKSNSIGKDKYFRNRYNYNTKSAYFFKNYH